jgi:hypothetical protein
MTEPLKYVTNILSQIRSKSFIDYIFYEIYDFIGVGLQSLTILRKSSNTFVKSSYSSLWNILPTEQSAYSKGRTDNLIQVLIDAFEIDRKYALK